jgi:2-polyprenyl-3-methyl-5-hydroxy-6-metoxy-1,4-benzoquinol methylase
MGSRLFALYDPGYPKHSALPKGKYDGVICTDVIEHIDEKDLTGF